MRRLLWQRLWLTLLLAAAGLAQPTGYRLLNRGREGQLYTVTDFLARGKVNVVVFTSSACPYSKALEPNLATLASRRSDLAVGRLEIDRPDVKGIDWQSPLARQYELRSVPAFKVYDSAGKLQAEGETARKMVARMLRDLDSTPIRRSE